MEKKVPYLLGKKFSDTKKTANKKAKGKRERERSNKGSEWKTENRKAKIENSGGDFNLNSGRGFIEQIIIISAGPFIIYASYRLFIDEYNLVVY